MDSCSWFAIESRTNEIKARDGVLLKVESHWWSAEYPDSDYDAPATSFEDDGPDTGYAFCSLTRPALLNRDGDRWAVAMLSPNDADGVFGYNETAYTFYFAACHDAAVYPYGNMIKFAQRLGYTTSADQAGQEEVSKPRDYVDEQ